MAAQSGLYELHYTNGKGEKIDLHSASAVILTRQLQRDFPRYTQQKVEALMAEAKRCKMHPVAYRHDIAETVVWFATFDDRSGYVEYHS